MVVKQLADDRLPVVSVSLESYQCLQTRERAQFIRGVPHSVEEA
jgi:hypothetical protein